jgi:BirA family biotin operon repressor/biotin-[acetyl-CoA-carboxylase] ligase
VVLRPGLPFEKWPRLTHACALAVCETLEQLPGLPPPLIKWPNDVYLEDRKVCGILVESVVDARGGFAIAGVGVNLNLMAEDLPAELRDLATSVWLERGGQMADREEFAIRFHRRLMVQCERAAEDFPALRAGCESRSYLTGRAVTLQCHGSQRGGIAAGLGPEGELRLQIPEEGREELIASADFVRISPAPGSR